MVRAKTFIAALVLIAGAAIFGQGLFLTAKAEFAQILLARAWTRAIDGETAATPWPWADTWPVARLSVPALGQHAIVLAEAGGEALAFGPALLNVSAQPGEPGTTIIAAHRDTHFEFLKDLAVGDSVMLETPTGEQIAYRVTNMEIVDAARSGIEPEGGPSRLALVTCWPFGALMPGPQRYVVWAEPVTAPEPLS
ncbi:class GN sortase [Maricaulis sp.]|uniref:class GN sortase n=1 Tax=Maricaulis sp. TaxID=1486257 RepID=UPI003A9517E6